MPAQTESAFDRFADLAALAPDEALTRVAVEDRALASGRRLALLTLDNGLGPRRPATLGPRTLAGLGLELEAQARRAAAGQIDALAVVGVDGVFAAGADLSIVQGLRGRGHGRRMAELGHAAYDLLAGLGVPTFAFVNGTALGGGLELALACTYRTVSGSAKGLGLPEAHLGLVPGWGGVYRLPRLVGPEAAVDVMLANALNNNRTLDGPAARRIGLADALLDADGFLDASLAWADAVLGGDAAVARPHAADPGDPAVAARWEEAAAAARSLAESKAGPAAPAPHRLAALFAAAASATPAASAAQQCDALEELIASDQFRASVYALLELLQKRAKRPAGVPVVPPRPVARVGVVGAGLMATQLALLFARRLGVPVVITDLDAGRVEAGLSRIRGEADRLAAKGRLSPAEAARLGGLVTGTTDLADFAGCDWVIEAVFEELEAKRRVFADVERHVSADCVLATNTSSLSVAAMAEGLAHPGRVVGFHFFNPVGAMPLIEIARTPATHDAAVATAFATAAGLGKTAVLVRDAPAFVVNRVLLRLLSEVVAAFDAGTPAAVADSALRPMGLPMTPFTLLAMVGLPVALHVQESLHAAFGARYPVSANLRALVDHGIAGLWEDDGGAGQAIPRATLELMRFGSAPVSADALLRRTQDALAEEIGLLLAEGVVDAPQDVDLCMILGAGWPLHLGGITPYLDRTGASARVLGHRFHPGR